MKTILIPVDFSATSNNAVDYAAEFCKEAPVDRVILLTTYHTSAFGEYLPSADFVQMNAEDIQAERLQIKSQMDDLSAKLGSKLGEKVKIQVAITEISLVKSITQISEQEKPELIIIGTENTNYAEESDISKELISIERASTISVLVVPAAYKYQSVKKVVMACDFKTVLKTDQLGSLEERYNWFYPELLVLNVDAGKNPYESDEQRQIVEENLKQILAHYNYKVYYVQDTHIINSITTFAREQHAQMIIALPGKHSFLYSLTHSSITESLCSDAVMPVLILK